MSVTLDWAEQAARRFETPVRRWATPGVMARELDPGTRQTPALDAIDAAVVAVADSDAAKQMIFAPPQTGKSERCSRRAPLWLLEHDPTLRIVIVAFETETAVRWGRLIKRDVEEHPQLRLELRQDSHAAGRWETRQGGGVYCVGIAGAFSGRAADLLIIDDPIKDRAHAESVTIRDKVWDFWENVAKVRARKTILIQTRWHTDDLAGRLLAREPGEWQVLTLPALAEAADDPLGRAVGEEIASANPKLHPPGYFARMRQAVSSYVWLSLYQQRPTAAEGGLFARGNWRYWTPGVDHRFNLGEMSWRFDDSQKFITIDLATSTKTSADWTVAAAWAIPPNGDLVLLDRVRQRVAEADHFGLVAPLRQRWLGPYDVTYVESRMFGTTFVYQAGRAGIPIAELKADVDKFTRAIPAANLVRQNRVWLPADAPWLDEWLDEHADFGPHAAHDDQVDVLAYAARMLVAHFVPMPTGKQVDAWRASGGSELDIMAIPY
jgi:predicted phage terminase large subunit-like protein